MAVPRQRAWTPLLKGYTDSRRINAVSEGAEALYCRLLAGSDDAGTYFGDPAVVRAKLLTFRMATLSVEDVDARLEELLREGLLVRYRSAGEEYVQLVGAEKGLRPDVKPKLQWPGPDDAEPGTLRVGGEPVGAPSGARLDPSGSVQIRPDPSGSGRISPGTQTDPDGFGRIATGAPTDPDGSGRTRTDPDGFVLSPNPNPTPNPKHKPGARGRARGGATPPPADAGSPALSGGESHEGGTRAGPHLPLEEARGLLAEFADLAPLEAGWRAYLAALEAWPGQRLPSEHQARHRLEQLQQILRDHGLEAARSALARATAGSAARGPWESIHHLAPSGASSAPIEGQPPLAAAWEEVLRHARRAPTPQSDPEGCRLGPPWSHPAIQRAAAALPSLGGGWPVLRGSTAELHREFAAVYHTPARAAATAAQGAG